MKRNSIQYLCNIAANFVLSQEYCLKFIVKESNCNQIVNSKEFESLDKPLMVEIIRRKLSPPGNARVHPGPPQDQVMGMHISFIFHM